MSTFSLFRAQELRSALALGLASTKMSGTAADARESVHSGNARPQTRGSASERQLTSSTRLRFFSSSSLLRRSSRSTCDSEVRRANAGKEHHRVTVTRGSATFSMLSLFQTFHDLCCKMLSLPNDMAARCWVNLPGPQAARSWSGHGPKARNSWALSSLPAARAKKAISNSAPCCTISSLRAREGRPRAARHPPQTSACLPCPTPSWPLPL